MKTKAQWLALLVSAVMVLQTQAHGFGGGGASSGGGGHFGGAGHVGGAHFSGSPTGYSGPRFSSVGGMRPPSVAQIRPSNIGRSFAASQSTRENIDRSNAGARFSNRGDRTVRNTQRIRNGVDQVRNGSNTLRPDWRNHVVAQHSATWHHGWDRGRDHWWHGHHCRFINGSWVIFDVGFDPWGWWPCPGDDYGYPCDDSDYDY